MQYFDKFITATQNLIRINSVESTALPNKPFGKGAYDALVSALTYAESLGFTVYNGNGYYGYAEIGSGELFGILGHLDTVPVGNDWSFPPFSGDIVDDELRGRGVLDDKAPIMACLYATAELYHKGKIPNKRIRIIFGCNEESGWKCIDKYLEEQETPLTAFSPDGDFPVINCERGVAYYYVTLPKPKYIASVCGGEYANMVMDKVVLELTDSTVVDTKLASKLGLCADGKRIIAHGVSAHGSTPHLGDNAVWKLFQYLSITFGEEWQSLFDITSNTDGSGYGLKCNDFSGNLTVNIGKINSTASEITFSLDIRHPLCITREQVYNLLCAKFDKYKVEYGAFHNPLYIAPDHKLCIDLLNAYTQVTKSVATPISIGGATYARALPQAVAFGPMFPGQKSTIHQKDERASIVDLEKMYAIYLQAIDNICFK